jgi:hypothetical protein
VIKTKHNGFMQEEDILSYYDRLIGKVFRLLPIKESNENDFLNEYEKLMHELICGDRLFLNGGFYIELLNKLEGLSDLPHKPFTKSKFQKRILECIDIINNLRKQKESEFTASEKY